jgi:hypothetical protein
MKLYSLTITAHVDDLDTLEVKLAAEFDLPSPELQSLVMSVVPAHLRKVAGDVEAQS